MLAAKKRRGGEAAEEAEAQVGREGGREGGREEKGKDPFL